ncbi:hypothetical protein PN465_15320 [Nodularia spumigena CS-584]|jgi:hypothetical protein|uniref:Nif11 domain-containing protein n=1 Tax=Nodularia spumigena UHCC 0060 TaxID=3110300 RepID=A0ABU5UU83_NODSP|nr:hypothetical protein [Nodularia spumigena]AHJ28159.1 hypothetical protein NSP_18260 [Nodularia spumigena CCY9414]EAW46726.1 hypothetical protein N9414_17153 [Nodularia spumigena CCY9414]MDB9383576.1 hypothetical protein [Nodularia spumigena CS-584]MEA5526058.1 hypothetical protein [Nodularia spumigena UHCC 0143]MEA5558218.1 hypothetical protein [Nodularia spumigena CH309]
MNLLRIRIHHLIEQLSDEQLQSVWDNLHALHCDSYMSQAIQKAKQLQQPWDILTHEEAKRMLVYL